MTLSEDEGQRLRQIQGRFDDATDGTWYSGEQCIWSDGSKDAGAQEDVTVVGDGDDGTGGFLCEQDTEFAAYAHADIPFLLALVKRLSGEK